MKNRYLGIMGCFLTGCYTYAQPQPIVGIKEPIALEQRMLEIIETSGECDKIRLDKVKLSDVESKLLSCNVKEGEEQYSRRWAINLDNIESINIKEEHFPWLLEYFFDDEIMINSCLGDSYRIVVSEDIVKEMAGLLETYRVKNCTKMEEK